MRPSSRPLGVTPRPRRIRRALAVALLALLAGRSLRAQDAKQAAVGNRVRLDVCDGATEPVGGARTGTLLDVNGTGVLLESEARIPLARVRGAQVNVRRSRELEPLGVIVGVAAGLWALKRSQGHGDPGGGLVFALPVFAIGGGVVGYQAGMRLSGEEQWAPMALPADHGSLCP